ncbi:MAG TPA: HAMP domain-containing sensor histidine kinase [Solirubrobacteraceae bacterium]|jgi:two-component system sensor histidine kinase MprB|nr:HAMP domain-containing sensor histidine kinase [Solirubrobacteraceae bacterium]
MTLRARISAVAGLAVALAVLIAAASLYVAVRSDLRGEVDKSLHQRAAAFVPQAAAGSTAGPQSPAGFPPPNGGEPPPDGNHDNDGFPSSVQPTPLGGPSGYVQFIAPDGSVRVPNGQGSSATIPLSASDKAIASSGKGQSLSDRSVSGVSLRVLALGTGARGAVLVARPLTEVNNELSRLLLILAIVGVVGIALAAALGAVVARAALTPIVRFTRRTETIAGGLDPAQRLPEGGRDELARLAASFNATLDALQRSVESQRNLVADAGHELRTPIASLRANIQVLSEAERLPPEDQASLRADIIGELDELTRLVGDVVELARGAEPKGEPHEMALEEIVRDGVQRAQKRSDATFQVNLEPTLVRGDAARIDRAVSNLLDNARKWSPPGEPIEVSLADGILTIRDHGPGFAQADLPHVFERFYRADRARKLPGSGLGLAIVRQAAEAHGGWVKAENAPEGGALVQVAFGASLELPDEAAGLFPRTDAGQVRSI